MFFSRSQTRTIIGVLTNHTGIIRSLFNEILHALLICVSLPSNWTPGLIIGPPEPQVSTQLLPPQTWTTHTVLCSYQRMCLNWDWTPLKQQWNNRAWAKFDSHKISTNLFSNSGCCTDLKCDNKSGNTSVVRYFCFSFHCGFGFNLSVLGGTWKHWCGLQLSAAPVSHLRNRGGKWCESEGRRCFSLTYVVIQHPFNVCFGIDYEGCVKQ